MIVNVALRDSDISSFARDYSTPPRAHTLMKHGRAPEHLKAPDEAPLALSLSPHPYVNHL